MLRLEPAGLYLTDLRRRYRGFDGGFGGKTIAVRAGGSGDITESRRLWLHPQTPQRIGSGVVFDGHIYIHDDPGVAMCLDLHTGETVWKERSRDRAARARTGAA